MKLSRFFHKTELNDGIYAIYNSLIMEIIYVDEKELRKILEFKVNSDDVNDLKTSGIYISSEEQDGEALKIVKDRYNHVSGNINVMYLVLTSACNLACKYCFIENCTYNNKKEITMTIDTAKTAIKKFSDYLNEKNIKEGTVIFYGGEPLINWDVLITTIEYAKELKAKIKFSIVSNATLLDINKIKFLAKNKVEVGISIDGPKELNDKNRIYKANNTSVYDQIIDKFSTLKISKCKFGLSITISEDFLEMQDEVLEWFKKLGVNSIFYNLYHYTSYTENWEDYYKKASKYLTKSYDILSKENIYDGRLTRKLNSIINSEFKFADCAAIGGNQIAIKPSGDVCICHGYLKTDKYIMGNINNDSIYELAATDEMNFWKKRCTLNNSECLSCEAIFSCGGGCAIQSEALFGDRNKIDIPFCIHTKTAMEWVLQKCYDKIKDEKKVLEEVS